MYKIKALAEARIDHDPDARCDQHEHHGDRGRARCAEIQCRGN